MLVELTEKQHIFKQLKNNIMKEKIKPYQQQEIKYSECEYIDYEYIRHCIETPHYTNNNEL